MSTIKTTRELVRELRVNGCTCIDDYKNRNRTDPQCHYCEYVDLLNAAADCIESRLADLAALRKERDLDVCIECRRVEKSYTRNPIHTECHMLLKDTITTEVDNSRILRKERDELKVEKQILLELFRRSHSEMSGEDYIDWYGCVVKILRAFKDGKRGVDITVEWDEHPELYEAPCYCKLCRSYGD